METLALAELPSDSALHRVEGGIREEAAPLVREDGDWHERW